MSIGGSKSSGKTTSTSASESEDWGSQVWGAQSPFLQDLYARSKATLPYSNTGTGYMRGADSQNNLASSTLYQGNRALNGALQAVSDSGYDLKSVRNALASSGGQLANSSLGLRRGLGTLAESNVALRKFLNPTVDPAVKAYSKTLGQQFNEQFLPGLKGDAAVAGGLGGSRAQIGAALGSQRAMQSLTDFTAQSYAGQQERALQAAQGIGALNQGYAQNAAGFSDVARGYRENSAGYQGLSNSYLDRSNQLSGIAQGFDQNAAGRLALSGNLQGQYDLARSMPWYGLQQYAGLLGLPVQNDLGGWTSSKTTSKGKSGGGGFEFGWG